MATNANSSEESDASEECGNGRNTNEVVVNLLEKYPILLNKSQTPEMKDKKKKALAAIMEDLCLNYAIVTNEKKLSKKILNLKQAVKKKTDIQKTGNKKILLNNWEIKMLQLLNSEENPVFCKIPGQIRSGIKRLADADPESPKKKVFKSYGKEDYGFSISPDVSSSRNICSAKNSVRNISPANVFSFETELTKKLNQSKHSTII